jgi:hypothetical protein
MHRIKKYTPFVHQITGGISENHAIFARPSHKCCPDGARWRAGRALFRPGISAQVARALHISVWASTGGRTMNQHRKASADEPPGAKPATPRGSPATDPTNPYRQEAAGIHATAEETNERKAGEPGLTDEDRDRRGASR